MSCSPFVAIDLNLMDKSMILSDESISAFTSSNISRVDSVAIQNATVLVNDTISNNINAVAFSDFPYLKDRFIAYPFSSVEIAEFVLDSFYSEFQIVRVLSSTSTTLTPEKIDLLTALNQFVDKEMGAATANGFCSAIAKSISKITSFITSAKNLFASIQNLVPQIMAMEEMLKGVIDKLVANVQQKIANILGSFKKFVGSVTSRVDALKLMTSKENVDILKGNVSSFIKRMIAQFKEMTLENISTVVLRMCQLIESIQTMFNNPMEGLKKFLVALENISLMQTNESNYAIARVNAMGIPMMSYTDRMAEINRRIQNQNGSAGSNWSANNGNTNGPYETNYSGYITLPGITDSEQQWLNQLNTATAPNDPNVKCANGVVNMAAIAKAHYNSSGVSRYWNENDNISNPSINYDSGLERIKETRVIVNVRRISQKLGIPLSITSGFRSDYRQSMLTSSKAGNVASPGSSPHRTGLALDIAYPGDDATCAKFVELASREGFTRIACYAPSEGGFFHIDKMPKNGWSKMDPSYGRNAVGPLTGDAMRRHLAGEFGKAEVVGTGNGDTRGSRNNNPGNIRDGGFAQGLPGYVGSDDKGFAVFDSPSNGASAQQTLLRGYIDKGFDTPAKIVNRWAPPVENNTSGYSSFVTSKTGFAPDQTLTYADIPTIAKAMAAMEVGAGNVNKFYP